MLTDTLVRRPAKISATPSAMANGHAVGVGSITLVGSASPICGSDICKVFLDCSFRPA